jgi:hypothetical protein
LEKIGFGFVSGRDFAITDFMKKFKDIGEEKEGSPTPGPINNTINGNGSGSAANLQDYMANDPRKKYIYSYKSKERQWGDKTTCERILQFAEAVYLKYGKITMVGDMCLEPVNGKWPSSMNGHKTHNDGASCDIVIEGLMMTHPNYDREKSLGALNIAINQVGTRAQQPSVYFDDEVIAAKPELKGMVKPIGGHQNHYHFYWVERQVS